MLQAKEALAATRPTAVNLFWALDKVWLAIDKASTVAQMRDYALREARRLHEEEFNIDVMLSKQGASLIPQGAGILTHCNTGALATGGYGTALGVIKKAHEAGKKLRVLATETRPLLQGARLTAFELMRAGINATLITDSMAGHFMQRGDIDLVIVGADRIAKNGDTANKIGTYSLAVLAKEHGLPFYVAAPHQHH